MDSQAPKGGAILADLQAHPSSGVQGQLDGPSKVGNTSTPTMPGNRTRPTSAKDYHTKRQQKYINTNRHLGHHKIGRSTIRKARQINSSRSREDRRCKQRVATKKTVHGASFLKSTRFFTQHFESVAAKVKNRNLNSAVRTARSTKDLTGNMGIRQVARFRQHGTNFLGDTSDQ